MPQLESAIAAAENAMAEFVSAAETQRLTHELQSLRSRHAAALEEWEGLSTELAQG